MDLISSIKRGWLWKGLDPALVVGENDFGNLIVKDAQGRYWRVCPEDLKCTVIANVRAELDALSQRQDFLHDWYMVALVEKAKRQLGPLRPGYKYCLKIPGPLGGEYGGTNLGTISLRELIEASGDIARQLDEVPDGAQVRLTVVE
jgi:hypothetical protein